MSVKKVAIVAASISLLAMVAILVWWSRSPKTEASRKSAASQPREQRPQASAERSAKKPAMAEREEGALDDDTARDLDPALAAVRRSDPNRNNIKEVRDHREGLAKGSSLEFKIDKGPRPILKSNILSVRAAVRKEVQRCTEAHAKQAPRKTRARVVFDLAARDGAIELERVQAEIPGGEYAEFEQCLQQAATGLRVPSTPGESQPDFATYQLAMGYRIR